MVSHIAKSCRVALGVAALVWLCGASLAYAEPSEFFPVPQSKPDGQPWCGDFEDNINWPAPGHTVLQPRGYPASEYQPDGKTVGALFAGPYQWGGQRCGGWCETDAGTPICWLNPYAFPAQKPGSQPWCGDFEGNIDWPAAGKTTAVPRGYPASEYKPDGKTVGALFAGPYQWGGERCGGFCWVANGQPTCLLR